MTPTISELQRQLDAIVRAHAITVEVREPRQMPPGVDAFSRRHQRKIVVPPLVDEAGAAAWLHETGHLLIPPCKSGRDGHFNVTPRGRFSLCGLCELRAWEQALELAAGWWTPVMHARLRTHADEMLLTTRMYDEVAHGWERLMRRATLYRMQLAAATRVTRRDRQALVAEWRLPYAAVIDRHVAQQQVRYAQMRARKTRNVSQ
jgi:hypothetical protein